MNRQSYGILAIAIMFGAFVNYYYGWNLTPQSDAEIICDGIFCLLLALGIIAGRPSTGNTGEKL